MDVLKETNPLIKFNALIIGLTTLLMFGLWMLLDYIPVEQAWYKWVSVGVSFVTSLGTYQSLVALFDLIFRKCRFFRKWILGPYSVEGIWVGYSQGSKGDIRFYYEKFEQGLENIVIHGQSFSDEGGYHGSWDIRNPMIDVESGEMTYCFEADSIGNTFLNPGFGRFTFARKSANSAPTLLRGYTNYVYNTEKLYGLEERLPLKDYTDEELFTLAKETYRKYGCLIDKKKETQND